MLRRRHFIYLGCLLALALRMLRTIQIFEKCTVTDYLKNDDLILDQINKKSKKEVQKKLYNEPEPDPGQCNLSRIMKSNSKHLETRKRDDSSSSSCAILFFGLPRCFKLYVLPSIIENVFIPNIENNCDYYIHFDAKTSESGIRGGGGGTIRGDDVFLLEDALRQIYKGENSPGAGKSIPHISITSSTSEEFNMNRNQTMHMYETTKDEDGNYLYYPWKCKSWLYPTSLRNMIRQWHSIDLVWQHMEKNAKRLKRNYSRVAMLRNDVMFVTPIDVYQLSTNKRDVENNHIVIPDWGKYPVNDRMVAGPYDAVKIWATERFLRIDKHVREFSKHGKEGPGWGMHSERFLNFTMLPAMLNASSHGKSFVLDENPNVCFLRARQSGLARSDGFVNIRDCEQSKSFDCDMEYEFRKLLGKHHEIAESMNETGLHCIKKEIQTNKIISCRENKTGSLM